MRFLATVFSLFFFLSFLSAPVSAQEKKPLPVITIINPIRGNELGLEKTDLLSSLQAQWKATNDLQLSATWLWQYSALENDQLVEFAQTQMKDQEFGLFLEIDRNTAQKAGVQYRGQGPWYFSDGLLLVSYDLDERKKLIDESFSIFKNKFGYYPKTVGAWWIGGDSLTYMQQKYGITAALKAADQYDLDVYSLWGSPWSIPYIASKENEGIPAGADSGSGVVILQWAARDPTSGYKDATYSVQDFHLKSYDFSYLDHLFPIFLKTPMDNIVIGLENGGDLESFDGGYGKYLKKAKELEDSGRVAILPAKEYAERFLARKSTFSDNRYFLSKSFKSEEQAFWYNAENYRAGIQKSGNDIYLIDLRDFSKKNKEEFSFLPNSQGYLRVSTPAIIDGMRMPSGKIHIAANSDPLSIIEKNNAVTLMSGDKKIAVFTNSSLELFSGNPAKIFNFDTKTQTINVFFILFTVFVIYFVAIIFITKGSKRSLLHAILLLVPLFAAYPFLSNGAVGDLSVFFDRKQLFLLSVFPVFSSIPIINSLIEFQVIPLLLLLIVHFVCMVRYKGKKQSIFFYFYFVCVALLYLHVPYFPLDKSTFVHVALGLLLLTIFLVISSIGVFKKTKSKKLLITCLISIPFLLTILVSVIYISRTKIILTPFEQEALQVIQERKKDVLFISQTNYGVKPIYKAVEPVLYENYRIGEKLTNTHWKKVEKTENTKFDAGQYADMLIVIPRFLGADVSEEEMNNQGAQKIFDNGHLAIFEKK